MNRKVQRQNAKKANNPTYEYKIKKSKPGRVLVNAPDKYGNSTTIAILPNVKEAHKYISSLVNNNKGV